MILPKVRDPRFVTIRRGGRRRPDCHLAPSRLPFVGGAVFVVIAMPAVARWRFGLNPILAFWFAYSVTRPLCASFADWMGVRAALDLGAGPGSLTLAALIVGAVVYLTVANRRQSIRFLR